TAMANPWFPPNGGSALSPLRFTTGDSSNPIPPLPPDPPDPDNPLSLARFPPLGSSSPKPTRASSLTVRSTWPAVNSSAPKTAAGAILLGPASASTGSPKSAALRSGNTVPPNFKILPPKYSSPIQTSKASSASFATHVPPSSHSPPVSPSLTNPNHIPPKTSDSIPNTEPPLNTPTAEQSKNSSAPAPTTPLVEKIRKLENKTLKRLAPVTLSDKGVPRVLIPDSVFQKGAEIHKDFIICYFNGRSPPFNQIQSVLNHMWGKGKRVEIHTNPLSRSMLVRIPSDYLRQKILEKTVWYVGDSMFHAVQWSSSASVSPPALESIQIWAHLTGVPLDLRHQEGLSLVAGLVGEPKETDDFTKNLVSLTLSHVKVAVDLTKPLPDVVEFVRQSGEVVEIQVSYPWVPPTCSFCKELGHVARNCLHAPPPAKSYEVPAKKPQKEPFSASQKGKNVVPPKENQNHPSSSSTAPPPVTPVSPSPPSVSTSHHPPPQVPSKPSLSNPSPSIPPLTSDFTPIKPSNSNLPTPHHTAIIPSPKSSPETFSTPSLKRPRPDPHQKPFPSFSAQLSYFSSIHPPILPLTLPPSSSSFVNPFSNTLSTSVPNGSLHHEETID
ncbi:hypothetical protein BRARA_G00406, partial [Brassica rapa]